MNMGTVGRNSFLFLFCAFLFILENQSLYAANDNIKLTKLQTFATGTLSKPVCDAGAQPLIDVAGDHVGCELWIESKDGPRKEIQLISGVRFKVEPLLGTLVSAGGKTILKYGDDANLYALQSSHRGFVLYQSNGQILAADDKHSLNSIIAMAKDGYFAIAGPRNDLKDKKQNHLTLYTADGKEELVTALPPGMMATKLALMNGAQRVAIGVTNTERQKNGLTDVLVFDRSGKLLKAHKDFIYPNKLIFVGNNGAHLLVFSINNLTDIDPNSGEMIWQVPRFYRLAGPYSVAMSKDKKLLTIVTAEIDQQKQLKGNRYLWRIHLLGSKSGLSRATLDLIGLHPVSNTRTIKWISKRSFNIMSSDTEYTSIRFE